MHNDWKWQLKNALTSLDALQRIKLINDSELHRIKDASFKITPYMAALIRAEFGDVLKKQFLPFFPNPDFEYGNDYLMETKYEVAPNLIHKYRNRAAMIVNHQCACYCQFCTRQRVIKTSSGIRCDLKQAIEYIRCNSCINDVLLTGGDPLLLETDELNDILQQLYRFYHVKVIRIGSRAPITLPMRIDDELLDVLTKYSPLYLNIHVNHPDEITPMSSEAILALANRGIPLGSQTVLLKHINDQVDILKRLFERLIEIKVKPYYLYQCDKVKGCEAFTVPPQKGIEIINQLNGQISGFALPKYVLDTPVCGKLVLAPCNVTSANENELTLLSPYHNSIIHYNIK